MTTFNELVTDLMNENLLDNGNFLSPPKTKASKVSEFPDSIELLSVTSPGLLELTEKHELKLPDFSFLKPELLSEAVEENRVKAILPTPIPQVTFHSTQNFIRYQNTRRKPKSKKKGTKFCRSCEIYLPFYYLNCRYCHHKLVGDLSYYLMMMFTGISVLMFVLYILSTKNYN